MLNESWMSVDVFHKEEFNLDEDGFLLSPIDGEESEFTRYLIRVNEEGQTPMICQVLFQKNKPSKIFEIDNRKGDSCMSEISRDYDSDFYDYIENQLKHN